MGEDGGDGDSNGNGVAGVGEIGRFIGESDGDDDDDDDDEEEEEEDDDNAGEQGKTRELVGFVLYPTSR